MGGGLFFVLDTPLVDMFSVAPYTKYVLYIEQ